MLNHLNGSWGNKKSPVTSEPPCVFPSQLSRHSKRTCAQRDTRQCHHMLHFGPREGLLFFNWIFFKTEVCVWIILLNLFYCLSNFSVVSFSFHQQVTEQMLIYFCLFIFMHTLGTLLLLLLSEHLSYSSSYGADL